jgi:PAS domain-containing protein
MRKIGRNSLLQFACTVVFSVCSIPGLPAEQQLPAFGKDTVLVWDTENQEFKSTLVVRIAEFLPDRFVEWEDETTQGTIFMPHRAVTGARAFVNSRLFEGGVDTKGKYVTTLWLSEQAFRVLKEMKRIKLALDSIDSWLTLEGSDKITVEVNRAMMELPVVKVKDDRGSERWFLDNEGNPLLVKHFVRQFSQTLSSITTDRHNTLRWIKGKKLTNPH